MKSASSRLGVEVTLRPAWNFYLPSHCEPSFRLCMECGGCGLITMVRQGDPVEGSPGFFHAMTVYRMCGCQYVTAPSVPSRPL